MADSQSKSAPFLMVNKTAIRKIRESLDSESSITASLAVLMALCEISSNMGNVQTFSATHAYIGQLCGMRRETVQKRVADLARIGVIKVSTPALKAPSVYTVPRCDLNAQRSDLNAQRCAQTSSRFGHTLEEKKKCNNTPDVLDCL